MVNHIVCSILRYVQQFIHILLAVYINLFKEERFTLKELLDIIRQEAQKYYEQNHHFFKRRKIFSVHNLALKNLHYNHSNHHSTLSRLNIGLGKRRSLMRHLRIQPFYHPALSHEPELSPQEPLG